MVVCSCNVLTDGQVRACLGPGPGCPRTAAQVYDCLGCSPRCGRCARTIREILDAAPLVLSPADVRAIVAIDTEGAVRLTGEYELRVGYVLSGQYGRNKPRSAGFYETAKVRVPVVPVAGTHLVAKLSRSFGPMRWGNLDVEYRMVEGDLMRQVSSPTGHPLCLLDIPRLHEHDDLGAYADYPSAMARGVGEAYRSVAEFSEMASSDFRGFDPGRIDEARDTARNFFARLRAIDGVLWRPCPPPAWGFTHSAPFLHAPAVVPVVPDLDLPDLCLGNPHGSRHEFPYVLAPPYLSAENLSAGMAQARDFDGPVLGTIECLSVLPDADLGRDNAWLIRRQAADEVGRSEWRHMHPLRRLEYATLDVVAGRLLGEVPGSVGTREDLFAAVSAASYQGSRSADAWLAATAAIGRYEAALEEDHAALAM